MYLLTNPVRDYAWGSDRRLAKFLGRAPSGGPEAELWIGAHGGDPSLLPDGRRLDDVIRAAPLAMLGERVHAAHGARLPFLMKVLAVADPLSLQVHPSSENARAGYDREEQAGVPVDAANRSYRDPWHKPELIYALTRFEGMAGFRAVERSAAMLRLLDHPWATSTSLRLEEAATPSQVLRIVVTDVLAMDRTAAAETLRGLVLAAEVAASREHERERAEVGTRSRRDSDAAAVRREAIRVFELLPMLADRYPDDPGVLVTLLLNHVVLAPGEAMFVGAGVVHAYVAGFGLEIMAASDNVLRAGLTPKHRDVRELIDVTDFAPMPAPRWAPAPSGSSETFHPPVADFALVVHRVGGPVRNDGPRMMVALEDDCVITTSDGRPAISLARGQAVVVPADVSDLDVRGHVAIGYVPASAPGAS